MKNVLIAFEFYRTPLFEGVVDYARQNDWHLSLEMLNRPSDIPWGWEGDGILTMLIHGNEELKRFLDESQSKIINLEGRKEFVYPRVHSNSSHVAKMAFDYFRTKGYRQFAFYGPENSTRGSYFSEHVQQAGYQCYLYAERELSWQDKLAECKEWLKEQAFPLAVYSWCDHSAASFIDMAKTLGYHIPHDIAVLGTDNEPLICNGSAISLSSIDSHLKAVGFRGAEVLDQMMMSGHVPPHSEMLDPIRTVERASSDQLAIDSPVVAKSIRYMKQYYPEGINIANVIQHVGLSRRGLEKAFMANFSMSPRVVLEKLRIEASQGRLRETRDSIQSIALGCGYSTPRNFSSIFKESTGMTPKEYRIHHQKF
jgi:LacI family transcriptional regulator